MSEVLYEKRGAAAWLTLDRPKDLNCLSPKMLEELDALLTRALGDPDVRSLVVTGSGRAFCAGADLKFTESLSPETRNAGTVAFLAQATTFMSRLEASPKPVIAAVNGVTVAGGMELLLCCDLVIAAIEARLGDGHANWGLLPAAGGSARLPRKIGATRAKYLFFTGDLLTASELMAAGLVNRVVPGADLVKEVEALTTKLAEKSPLALRRMKELADDALDQPLAIAIRTEQATAALHSSSFDFSEGMRAFGEKRKPSFQGR